MILSSIAVATTALALLADALRRGEHSRSGNMHSLRGAIIFGLRRYGLDPSCPERDQRDHSQRDLFSDRSGSCVWDLRAALIGPFGYRLSSFWPDEEALPVPGYATRFDPIVPWLLRELDRGQGPRPGMAGMDAPLTISKVLDWYNAEIVPQARGSISPLEALEQYNWTRALMLADRWHAEQVHGFSSRMSVSPAACLMSWPDGARIDRLTRQEHFDEEGYAMHHCLRRHLHYWDDVLDGERAIYSYRDSRGVPQATWELDLTRHAHMVQLQGVGNGPISGLLARERIAHFLLQYMQLGEIDGMEGIWTDRLQEGPRGLLDSWKPLDNLQRIAVRVGELDDEVQYIQEGDYGRRAGRFLERYSDDLMIGILSGLEREGLISGWDTAASVARDVVNSWYLELPSGSFLLELVWEEERRRATWSVREVGSGGGAVHQHLPDLEQALSVMNISDSLEPEEQPEPYEPGEIGLLDDEPCPHRSIRDILLPHDEFLRRFPAED